jgi:hypothetical protein
MASILGEIVQRLIGPEIEASVTLVKIQSAIVYLHALKNARRLAKIICLLILFVIVLACGFLLVPVALCLFMPWAPETKAIVAASFGAAYVIIPLIVILVLFREKTWIRMSKADALLKDALKR